MSAQLLTAYTITQGNDKFNMFGRKDRLAEQNSLEMCVELRQCQRLATNRQRQWSTDGPETEKLLYLYLVVLDRGTT